MPSLGTPPLSTRWLEEGTWRLPGQAAHRLARSAAADESLHTRLHVAARKAHRVASCVSSEAVMAKARCLWCKRPFEPRRGGSRQRFCCPSHRSKLHTTARLWAERAISAGILTIPDLQKGAGEPCTLLSGRRTGGAATGRT